jgi:hypothetical protein
MVEELNESKVISVRVEVYIDKELTEGMEDVPGPNYVYDKLIPQNAIKDLEDELDTVVGQYPDNPSQSYTYDEDEKDKPLLLTDDEPGTVPPEPPPEP